MTQTTGTLLFPCDIGARWGRTQVDELARKLEARLQQPVVAVGDWNEPSGALSPAIRALLDVGTDRIVVLPLGLLSESSRDDFAEPFARAIQQARAVQFHVAAPLTRAELTGWLRATAIDALTGLAMRPDAAAVLLVGENETPEANAELAGLAHLVLESSPFARVQHAYLDGARPAVRDALIDLSRLGSRQIVVLPWLLEEEARFERLRDDVVEAAQVFGLSASLSIPSLSHPALVNLLVSNHCAALSDEPVSLGAPSEPLTPDSGDSSPASPTVTPASAVELELLERRINALLPPEYKGRYEDVRPRSMGTAELKTNSEGKIAWGEIWTSFCDLALAGGPPHRGKLLEAVTTEEALADPEAYQKVVDEIERGIRLVTNLPVVASRSPGWVGVRCESEEMAVWLMRAIIVENVMVRREGDTLYLPAGPRFTVEREIKNVITTIAKTVHYWTAHLTARQQP